MVKCSGFSRLIKNSGNKQVLLGRWNSINKEEVKNKNIVWSNYDNCFTSIKKNILIVR